MTRFDAALGRAVTRVWVEERHVNFNGGRHGGLTFTLAGAAFGYASNSYRIDVVRADGTPIAGISGPAFIAGRPAAA